MSDYYDTSYPPSLWAPEPPPTPVPDAPTLTAVDPPEGINGGVVEVTCTGTGFTPDTKITVGVAVLTTIVVSETECNGVVNLNFAPGTYDVTVTNVNGESNAQPFTVEPETPEEPDAMEGGA